MNNKAVIRLISLLIVTISLFKLSCNETNLDNISEDGLIGPEGGIVIGEDGIILDIPPGALDSETAITAKLISESEASVPPPEGFSFISGVDLNPEGLIFNLPITITLPTSGQYPVGAPFPLILLDHNENEFTLISEALINSDGNSVSAQLTHFSEFFITTPKYLLDSEGNFAGKSQRELKEIMVNRIVDEVINKYETEEYCFHDNINFKNILSFGDVDKIISRLDEVDIVVNEGLDPRDDILFFLKKPEGIYCGGNIPVLGSCSDCYPYFYCDDIILPRVPSSKNVKADVLHHEMIHALLNDYRDDLDQLGLSDDEVITNYFDSVFLGIENFLPAVEKELAKARNGEPCSQQVIADVLDKFVNFGNAASPSLGDLFLDIPMQVHALVYEKIGFYVDPFQIKQIYEEGVCGVCDTSTQPSPEICDDGVDNDQDGFIDCDDISCDGDVSCDNSCDLSSFQFVSFEDEDSASLVIEPTISLNGVSEGLTVILFPPLATVTDFFTLTDNISLFLTAYHISGNCAGHVFSSPTSFSIEFNGAIGFPYFFEQPTLESFLSYINSQIGCESVTLSDLSIDSIWFYGDYSHLLFIAEPGAMIAIGFGQNACSGDPMPEPTPIPTPIPTPPPTAVDCSPPSWTATPGSSRTFMASGGTGNYFWSLNPPDANCTSTINDGGASLTISCTTIGNREIFLEDDDPGTPSDTCVFRVTKPIFGEF